MFVVVVFALFLVAAVAQIRVTCDFNTIAQNYACSGSDTAQGCPYGTGAVLGNATCVSSPDQTARACFCRQGCNAICFSDGSMICKCDLAFDPCKGVDCSSLAGSRCEVLATNGTVCRCPFGSIPSGGACVLDCQPPLIRNSRTGDCDCASNFTCSNERIGSICNATGPASLYKFCKPNLTPCLSSSCGAGFECRLGFCFPILDHTCFNIQCPAPRVCYDTLTGPACRCPPGFAGAFCEYALCGTTAATNLAPGGCGTNATCFERCQNSTLDECRGICKCDNPNALPPRCNFIVQTNPCDTANCPANSVCSLIREPGTINVFAQCSCQAGYVFNADRQCVKPTICSNPCPTGQVCVTDGTAARCICDRQNGWGGRPDSSIGCVTTCEDNFICPDARQICINTTNAGVFHFCACKPGTYGRFCNDTAPNCPPDTVYSPAGTCVRPPTTDCKTFRVRFAAVLPACFDNVTLRRALAYISRSLPDGVSIRVDADRRSIIVIVCSDVVPTQAVIDRIKAYITNQLGNIDCQRDGESSTAGTAAIVGLDENFIASGAPVVLLSVLALIAALFL